jgi:hypothetical protein
MKRKLRVHGKWKPGEDLLVSDRAVNGVYDAYTPEYEKKVLSQMVPYLSGMPPPGEPVIEIEVDWPDEETR